jgi:hypothetical protein
MLDKTTKQANSIDVAIPNNHNLHTSPPRGSRSVQTWKKNLQECGNWKRLI